MIKVVGGIVFFKDRVLIAKRGDRWEFPGGKVEKGETLFEALVRELKEELRIRVIPRKIVGFSDFFKNRVKHRLYGILADIGEGEAKVRGRIKWVDINSVDKYDFLEPDRKFLAYVKEELAFRRERLKNIKELQELETSGQTFCDEEALFPPFFIKAKGEYVYDERKRRYIDFTGFFGVAVSGHSPKFLKKAVKSSFFHGFGDLVPSKNKVILLKKLKKLFGNGYTFSFHQNGSDAVEFAIRTAYLYKKSPCFISFKGNYHGVALSVLPFTGIDKFKSPFKNILPFKVKIFEPLRKSLKSIKNLIGKEPVSAIIVEPIQMRAGVRIIEREFLKELSYIAKENSVPLIFDEIYTGVYKTGAFLYSEILGIEPDIITIGKALSGSFPISITAVKKELGKIWENEGESIFTHTFSGNPFFIELAILNLEYLDEIGAKRKVIEIEEILKENLNKIKNEFKDTIKDIRGKGILWGIEFYGRNEGYRMFRKLFSKGFITLPAGENGEVLSISPPLVIKIKNLKKFFRAIRDVIR